MGLQVSAGQHLPASIHHSGIGQAPGVDVVHGDDRQNRVIAADVQLIGQRDCERMERNGAVRIDNALGPAGSS